MIRFVDSRWRSFPNTFDPANHKENFQTISFFKHVFNHFHSKERGVFWYVDKFSSKCTKPDAEIWGAEHIKGRSESWWGVGPSFFDQDNRNNEAPNYVIW
jgi:hypothetical protein